MEFITSEFQQYLISRGEKVDELAELVRNNPIVLLLGESGSGKTSALHAGLIPKAIELGWRPVYCRPLGLPSSDILQAIQSSLFGGSRSHRSDLLPVLAEGVAALNGQRLLVIVDQFEDVLAARNFEDVRALIASLSVIRQLGDPSLRIIISYRADLEARLGEYWQTMSGSPSGLPRVYVAGLDQERLWARIKNAADDLHIRLDLSDAESRQIINDLTTAGLGIGVEGIYPPHVQMLIDHLWKFSVLSKSEFTIAEYRQAGGIQGIIGNYLARQLEYAHDVEGNLRSVLVSLVRSYGVKAQKAAREIESDTGLDAAKCETALEKLIDLRLVRHVGDYYEITHDFVARKVIAELVDSEEKEFKRFRELLASKAAAYGTTHNSLTGGELLMIYKHRQRIIPTPAEVQLLLIAFIEGTGPTVYWLLNVPWKELLALVVGEERRQQLKPAEQANVLLLKRKLDAKMFRDADFACFRAYERSWELARLLALGPTSLPPDVISFGLRHRREEVIAAALRAVAARMNNGDLGWITLLRASSSIASFRAYLWLVASREISLLSADPKSRTLLEFSLLQRLQRARSAAEVETLWHRFIGIRSPNRVRLFGEAVALVKSGTLGDLLELAETLPKDEALIVLDAVSAPVSREDMQLLLDKLTLWIKAFPSNSEATVYHGKPVALSEAILRVSQRRHVPQLRKYLKTATLSPPMRSIVLALMSHGSLADLKTMLRKIAAAEERVEFWNHIGLGVAAAALVERSNRGTPKFLGEVIDRREFWNYLPAEERRKAPATDLLPIKNVLNRALFVRLVGCGLIGAATFAEPQILVRLSCHSYGFLARLAATRLADLHQQGTLNLLSEVIEARLQQPNVEAFSNALRLAKCVHLM
jgi:conflict system STAND superfamily ATPase